MPRDLRWRTFLKRKIDLTLDMRHNCGQNYIEAGQQILVSMWAGLGASCGEITSSKAGNGTFTVSLKVDKN